MQETQRGFWRYWMAIVPLAILSLACIVPILVTLHQSFVRWEGLRPDGWGTWEGYQQVFKPQRLSVLGELVFRATIVASINLIIAIPLADFIVRRKSPAVRMALLMALTVPFVVSATSRAFGWAHLLGPKGMLNAMWLHFSPHAQPLPLPQYSRTAVLVALVAATLPFAVFPIVLALPDDRQNLWSACADLRTGVLIRLRRIVVPIALAGIFVGWLSTFWLAFGSSVEASVVDGPMEVSLGKLITELRSANEFAAADALSASIVLTFVLLAIFAYLLLRRRPDIRAEGRFNHPRSATTAVQSPRPFVPFSQRAILHPRLTQKLRIFVVVLAVFVVLGFVFAPVASILALSVTEPKSIIKPDSGGLTLTWYLNAITADDARQAWKNSLMVAVPVGIVSAAFAFAFGLTWWSRIWRWVVVGGLSALALLPPDAYALGVLHVYKALGFRGGSLLLVGLSHVAWALPFATAVMFSANSNVDPFLFTVGMEMRASRFTLMRRVLLGLTWPAIVSAFLIGAFMSLNEHTRASYLSGSNQILSQYIYGQMKSGTNPSVYAIGGVNVLVAGVLFIILLGSLRFVARRAAA